jgi:RNA polymerase sigma factor (sigma-70 family)
MDQDDAELVERVLAGEKFAFGPLIDRYRPRAIKLARRMLGDGIDAEDVTQEALLQAFLCLAFLRTPGRFGAWLLGIVVNLCRMRIRTKRDWHPAAEWHGGRVPEDFTLADLQPSRRRPTKYTNCITSSSQPSVLYRTISNRQFGCTTLTDLRFGTLAG